jgi:hypothetical protein
MSRLFYHRRYSDASKFTFPPVSQSYPCATLRFALISLVPLEPKLGVLDECTSAVSIDVEERLYRTAAEMGIACISLSQRLALEEFHTQELRLGANNARGWERTEIVTSLSPATQDTLPELHKPREDAVRSGLQTTEQVAAT